MEALTDPMIAGVYTDLFCRASFAKYTYPETLFAAEAQEAADVLARAICHSHGLYVREKHHQSSVQEFVQ